MESKDLGWVVAVDDITPLEERLGRESVKGNRHRPDGTSETLTSRADRGTSTPSTPARTRDTGPAAPRSRTSRPQ